ILDFPKLTPFSISSIIDVARLRGCHRGGGNDWGGEGETNRGKRKRTKHVRRSDVTISSLGGRRNGMNSTFSRWIGLFVCATVERFPLSSGFLVCEEGEEGPGPPCVVKWFLPFCYSLFSPDRRRVVLADARYQAICAGR